MIQLYANTAGENPTTRTLAAGQTSQKYGVGDMATMEVTLSGAFDSRTVTMEESSDGINWSTYSIDVNGTQTPQTWTGTNATGDSNRRGFRVGSQFFRWAVNGTINTGTAAIKVEVAHKYGSPYRRLNTQ